MEITNSAPMNILYYGDNLPILKKHIPSESIDLIYLDPPFNSNRSYNVLFKDESGGEAEAQITAFEDTWHWTRDTERLYTEIVTASLPVSGLISALRFAIGTNQMMAYLVMMTARLIELHRVLKPTGSLYLHCDPTASHYLKIVLDMIFRMDNFQNEINWVRTNAHNFKSNFYQRTSDILLFYTKTADYIWNQPYTTYSPKQLKRYKKDPETGRLYTGQDLTLMGESPGRQFEWRGSKPPPNRVWGYSLDKLEELWDKGLILKKADGTPRLDGMKVFLDEMPGKTITSIWDDIPRIGNTSSERLGYPTQKPVALLERIIKTSSNEGDVVLDPFCGCGTAIVAAQKLGRQWIGIDITHLSISLMKYRLKDSFHLEPKKDYWVIGEPEDISSARQLAVDDRYQFQWWALSLIKARPVGDKKKKGADRGIDGLINFIDDDSGKAKRALVQVKSGHVNSSDIRDLIGVLEREKAEIGVFITLEPPTAPMQKEAVTAGFYHSPGMNNDYPKIQIVTIEDLLQGAKLNIPQEFITFKANKAVTPDSNQTSFY